MEKTWQMNRKMHILLLLFICVVIHSQPITHTAPNYLVIDYGFFQDSIDYGPLSFTPSMLVSQLYFNNGYSYFTNLRESGETYLWSLLGMRCTPNGNITLTNLSKNEIELEVNGPTGNTTTVKTHLSGRNMPEDVTGVDAWSYNETNETLTFYVTHSSPVIVTISLAAANEVTIQNNFPLAFVCFMFAALGFMYYGWTQYDEENSLIGFGLSLLFWVATIGQWVFDTSTDNNLILWWVFLAPLLLCVIKIGEAALKYMERGEKNLGKY